MIKTILVPLDGSPRAEQALPHARRLARMTGAGLVLVRAAPHAPLSGAPASALRITVRDADAYLEPLRQQLRADGFTAAALALHADPLRAIRYAARTYGADLIAMTTRGRSAVGRALLGSVAQDVLQHTTVPLLLVRAAPAAPAPAPDRYRRILVPLDGTALGEAALAYLARGELGRDLDVVLLRALPPAEPILVPGLPHYAIDTAYVAERGQERASQYLAHAGDAYLRGWTYRTQILGEQPAGAIDAVAEVQDIDLIVMATHARAGLGRLAYGSVAEQVLRHAPAPVLLLHGISDGVRQADAHAAGPQAAVPEPAAPVH
jgi:nucleotide-binding universal stress UspA family protein